MTTKKTAFKLPKSQKLLLNLLIIIMMNDSDPDLSFMDEESGTLSDKEANISSPSYQDNLGNSHGFILVNVRTGRDSGVVEGARVVITSLINGARIIMASGVTDISGATQVFELPAPDKSFSQTPTPPVRPYSLFNISVTADGFFNSLSIDVPVFSGITSVQNFNMVPVPLFTEPSSETVIYYNQDPFYDEYASQEVDYAYRTPFIPETISVHLGNPAFLPKI